MESATSILVETSLTPVALTVVLACVLGAAWRSYGQRYLAYWTMYWVFYAVAWPLLGASYWAGARHYTVTTTILQTLTSTIGFCGRGMLVLGVFEYMGWKRPSRAAIRAVFVGIVGMAIAGLYLRGRAAEGLVPHWAAVPFRSFTIGSLVEIALAVSILRKQRDGQRLPQVVLATAALVAAASDLYDFSTEVFTGALWADDPTGLRISLFVSQVTDALLAAGMLVSAIGTERLRAERALEELRKRDEQLQKVRKIEAVGQLAGGLAHDFNNLLTVIVASLDFIRGRLPKGDPAHEDVDAAALAADRAARLTRQLLTFARRQTVEPRLTNLSDTVASLDRVLSALVGERVTRKLRLSPVLWPVWVDPAQVEQMLVNLVVNSRDAMPAGGVLTIETANVENERGAWVMIAIEDTGEGMTDATKKRIFEPFFTTKGIGKGTGLGLATVYGIVQQAGGYLEVSSEHGHGARFTAYLPRAHGSPAVSVPAPLPTRGTGDTVLVVENEPGVRIAAARALSQVGYRVVEASGGDEALRMPLDGVSLAVVDIVMPGMDGWQLARELRRRRPRQKVLFISGFVPSHDEVKDDGPSSFLAKPFTPDQLVRRVTEMIEQAEQAA